MQGGEAAMVELLGAIGLTAVFAYNDSMAAGALTTLKDNGIVVPQHLSLIGFDDIPISRYTDLSSPPCAIRYVDGKAGHRAALLGRPASWIARQRTALCRRWCAVIPLPSGNCGPITN